MLRGIGELPPLVMYTSTYLTYSPIATNSTELGVSTSSLISLRWSFPSLESKLQCWPSLTLTVFRQPSLSTTSQRYRNLLSPFDPVFASLQSVLNKTEYLILQLLKYTNINKGLFLSKCVKKWVKKSQLGYTRFPISHMHL